MGGLVVLVVLGRTVERRAVRQFAVLAMTSVIILVATGILNSVRNLHSVDQLFLTRYGLLLVGKIASGRRDTGRGCRLPGWVRGDRLPGGSVRLEAGLTVAVLTVTAFLSMTSPPPQSAAATAGGTTANADPAPANGLALMSLGHQGTAGMGIIPATTRGSRLHLLLTDPAGSRSGPLRSSSRSATPDGTSGASRYR